MKLMIASDIHGSLYYCNLLLELYGKEKSEKLLLLGDLLYDGPRNPIPRDYDPRAVYKALNGMKEDILCVRGNCDSDTDLGLLEFPVAAESLLFWLDGHMVFSTHGHLYNNDHPPVLRKGDVLLNGHFHINAAEERGDYVYLNPGSVTLPLGGSVNSYMVYEGGTFTVKDLEGNPLKQYSFPT